MPSTREMPAHAKRWCHWDASSGSCKTQTPMSRQRASQLYWRCRPEHSTQCRPRERGNRKRDSEKLEEKERKNYEKQRRDIERMRETGCLKQKTERKKNKRIIWKRKRERERERERDRERQREIEKDKETDATQIERTNKYIKKNKIGFQEQPLIKCLICKNR